MIAYKENLNNLLKSSRGKFKQPLGHQFSYRVRKRAHKTNASKWDLEKQLFKSVTIE